MASDYPGALDVLGNPTNTTPMNDGTYPHAQQHADANDAIEAIQATLGVDPQGSEATVGDRIAALEVGAAGLVPIDTLTLSADTTKSLNSCFSSTYRHYRLMFDVAVDVASGDSLIQMRWRSSGSDRSSANTYSNAMRYYSATNSAGQELAADDTLSYGVLAYSTGDTTIRFALDVYAPYDSGAMTSASGIGHRIGSSFIALYGGFHYDTADQNDGFTLFTDNGTLTGTVRVYGYTTP